MLLKAVVVVVLAAILIPFLRTMWGFGWHLHYYKHHPGRCWSIKRPGTGSEDFQILSSGLTFITSGLSMSMFPPGARDYVKSKGNSSIQLLDMNVSIYEAKALTIKHDENFNPDTFHPHGLSVLEDKVNGEHLVYVVNHVENEDDRVEKFSYSPKTQELHHEKSFFSDFFHVTNDLFVVAEDRFYISNWLYFKTEILFILEQVYSLPTGGVVFYNGTGYTTVLKGIHDPNGVMMSKDKRHLYVSLPNLKVVNVYERDSDYDFRLVQEVKVHTGLDNFHLSKNGDSLFGGCFPITHKTLAFLSHPTGNKSPSQVLRLPLKDGLIVKEEITQLFYDHGDLISGCSIAGVYKDKLLIGSVIDTLAMCQLPTNL